MDRIPSPCTRCRLTKRGSTIEPGSTLAHLQRATLRFRIRGFRARHISSESSRQPERLSIIKWRSRSNAQARGSVFGCLCVDRAVVGVIPVAIGLLWFPLVARLGKGGLDFVLALTVGLLIFLMVDATAEGLEAAETIPRSYQPTVLFAFAAGASYSRWPGSAGGSAVGEQAVANRRAQGGFWHSSWRSESVCTTSARDSRSRPRLRSARRHWAAY